MNEFSRNRSNSSHQKWNFEKIGWVFPDLRIRVESWPQNPSYDRTTKSSLKKPFNFQWDFMVYQISYFFDEIPSSQMISNERILEFMWPGNNLLINYRQFHKHIIAYDKFLLVPDEPHCFRIDPKNFCSDPKNFVPIPKFRWFHFHWNERKSLGQLLPRFQR